MSINRHEKERQRTRFAFLNAGLSLILEKGYDNVTVKEITALADYGRSTFYEHFADKESLARAILEHHILTLDAEITEVTADYGSPEQEWIAWLMICEDVSLQRQVFLKMDTDVSRRLRQFQKDMLIMGFQMKYEADKSLLLSDIAPAIRARYVVGAGLEILDYWMSHPELGTAKDIAQTIFTLIYKIDPPQVSIK